MAAPSKQHSKILFTNANIITMDRLRPRAQWLAIRGGLILLVGNNSNLNEGILDDFKEIDCNGRTILPAFNDK